MRQDIESPSVWQMVRNLYVPLHRWTVWSPCRWMTQRLTLVLLLTSQWTVRHLTLIHMPAATLVLPRSRDLLDTAPACVWTPSSEHVVVSVCVCVCVCITLCMCICMCLVPVPQVFSPQHLLLAVVRAGYEASTATDKWWGEKAWVRG